jgi:hypothetical protein
MRVRINYPPFWVCALALLVQYFNLVGAAPLTDTTFKQASWGKLYVNLRGGGVCRSHAPIIRTHTCAYHTHGSQQLMCSYRFVRIPLSPPLIVLSFLYHPASRSIDWVQDPAVALATWGDIGDWDVSSVQDMSHAFSLHRDAAGGSDVANGNSANIASFTGDGIEKWSTGSVTNLERTFYAAVSMNVVNLGTWDVSKVTIMLQTFYGAVEMNTNLDWDVSAVTTMSRTFLNTPKFVGAGLNKWITTSVTSLSHTFHTASSMNADVGNWDISKVVNMELMFYGAAAFEGNGLDKWDTSALLNMDRTFQGANNMDADLGKWVVSKVIHMGGTFNSAKFVGTGLSTWITTSLQYMDQTFRGAAAMNGDVSGWNVAQVAKMQWLFADAVMFEGVGLDKWNVAQVTDMGRMFDNAAKFVGTGLGKWNVAAVKTIWSTFNNAISFNGDGLEKWNIAAVTDMVGTFTNANALISCNKRKIVDAWTPISAVFVATTYDTDWAGEPWCVGAALSDAQFKQATWGTYV